MTQEKQGNDRLYQDLARLLIEELARGDYPVIACRPNATFRAIAVIAPHRARSDHRA
jgi:hypothetical protein